MTTQLKEKLERIKAALRAWVEADKARRDGEWKPEHEGSPRIMSPEGDVALVHRNAWADDNTRFITICSTMSRPSAEALLVAIDALEWTANDPTMTAKTELAAIKLEHVANCFDL
jgi:hypothetical protein